MEFKKVVLIFAVAAAAILAGTYSVVAGDWCKYFPSGENCTPEFKPIDPDDLPKENPTDKDRPAPADPILREDGAFCAEHPDHPDCIVDGPPGCADKDQCE